MAIGVLGYFEPLGWAAMSAERKRMWLIVVVCFSVGFAWSWAYDQYHLSFWWALVIFAALVRVAWLRDRAFKRKQRGEWRR